MYPYFTRFQPEDDQRFWFYNSMHFPEPMPAFDTITAEVPYSAIGANTARVFVFPTTLGIEHRIVNGRVYITANPVTRPRRDRAPGGDLRRAGQLLLRELGHPVRGLEGPHRGPDRRDRVGHGARTAGVRGRVGGLRVARRGAEPLRAGELPPVHRPVLGMWHHHTEFLMLGYGAYVVFFQFCKQAFPEISDQTVARMVAGIDVIMYRPDDELRGLARLAVEAGVDDLFTEGCSPSAVLAALADRGEGGQRWLAAFEQARDPWFNVSTGDGFYHHHRSWADDLTVPFAALPRYVAQVRDGTLADRPTEALRAERDRIASAYRDAAVLRRGAGRVRPDARAVPGGLPVRGGPQVLLRALVHHASSSPGSASSARCWPGSGCWPRPRTCSSCTTPRSTRRCRTSCWPGPRAGRRWARPTCSRSWPSASGCLRR